MNDKIKKTATSAEPVAWANGDELDNMLDDRTATVSEKPSGFRRTPLFRKSDGLCPVPTGHKPVPSPEPVALQEALDEWVAVRQDLNGMALLGKEKDETDKQRHAREAKWTRLGHAEHALMEAALSRSTNAS